MVARQVRVELVAADAKHGTGIEWTHLPGFKGETWNPLRGRLGMWWCTKIRPGCAKCYAERFNLFRGGPNAQEYKPGLDSFDLHLPTLAKPTRWRKPRSVFVCSMTDLFHPDVPDAWVLRVFEAMSSPLCAHHVFMVLSKHGFGRTAADTSRILAMRDAGYLHPWPSNVWLGTSLENDRFRWCLDRLAQVDDAPVRFVSAEPLLSALPDLDLSAVDWMITGLESGPGARTFKGNADAIRDLRDQCGRAGVPFFFKQWGGPNKALTGRTLDGRQYSEFPTPRIAA